jgi:hypothetical protein
VFIPDRNRHSIMTSPKGPYLIENADEIVDLMGSFLGTDRGATMPRRNPAMSHHSAVRPLLVTISLSYLSSFRGLPQNINKTLFEPRDSDTMN